METRAQKRSSASISQSDSEAASTSASVPKRKKSNETIPRILDNTFFNIVEIKEKGIIVRCTECKELKKGELSSTGNFKTHYRIKHPALLTKLEEHLKKKSIETRVSTQPTLQHFASSSNLDTVIIEIVILLIFELKRSIFHFQLTDDLVNVTIDNNLPYNFLRSSSLHTLLENISGRKILFPSMRQIMGNLSGQYERMKKELIRVLQNQKYVCVTCDVWSSRGQSFIGITVHYITESYERKSYVLAFRPITGKQSYDVLAKIISSVFKEYGLPVEKITHIVTDGGSAFCKAFRIYGKRSDDPVEDCEVEVCSETADNGENTDTTADLPFMQENGELFYSNVIELNSNDVAESFLNSIRDDQDECSDDQSEYQLRVR